MDGDRDEDRKKDSNGVLDNDGLYTEIEEDKERERKVPCRVCQPSYKSCCQRCGNNNDYNEQNRSKT